jgi:hypothetical protein
MRLFCVICRFTASALSVVGAGVVELGDVELDVELDAVLDAELGVTPPLLAELPPDSSSAS